MYMGGAGETGECVCRDWSMDVALKMSACVCVCVWMERREVWVGSKRCLCIYRERSVVAERELMQ